jgi:ParB/RepB/Spo0J family partition protein
MTAVMTDRHDDRQVSIPAPRSGALLQIQLVQLVESPWNPRKHFDPAKLAEMAESLRKGQLAPIIVRPISGKHERYEIGAGHRRFRSAPAAGLTSLLAIVRDLDDVAFLELLTIENKQREDVAPLDEANGFKLLMEKAGYDVAKLAARIGLSTKYVYDRLKLLQLVPAAKKLLEDGVITAGHAILLARLSRRRIRSARSATWKASRTPAITPRTARACYSGRTRGRTARSSPCMTG